MPGMPISAISLGATRTFKARQNKGNVMLALPLTHGSLFIMGGAMQELWKHTVEKEPSVVDPRCVMTFRVYNDPKSSKKTVEESKRVAGSKSADSKSADSKSLDASTVEPDADTEADADTAGPVAQGKLVNIVLKK